MTAPTRNLFICGLHRSGTTLLTQAIASHPEIATFRGTSALEQEGQFLQSILPFDQTFGGPGRFAFAPQSHLTEASAYATPQNAARLAAEWARHCPGGHTFFAEKSPPNLLRTRLLQALFPEACFIVLTRHPIPVALATQKWTHTSPFSLIAHWVHAHNLFARDMPHLRQVLMLSYEGFIADPAESLARIWRFLGLKPHRFQPNLTDRNQTYFERWLAQYNGSRAAYHAPNNDFLHRLRKKLRPASAAQQNLTRFEFGRRSDAQDAIVAFDDQVREFGYSLVDFSLAPWRTAGHKPEPLRTPAMAMAE